MSDPLPSRDARPGDASLPRGFRETVSRLTSNDAVIDGGIRLSFAALATQVARAEAELARLGVTIGDRVVLQLPNWAEAVSLFLAVLGRGATVVPVVPSFREAELAHVLAEIRPRVVAIPSAFRRTDHRALLAAASRRARVSPDAVLVVRDSGDEPVVDALPNEHRWAAGAAGQDPVVPMALDLDPRSAAVVIYTSGSTGAPKGVRHSHATLTAELRSLPVAHGLGPGDRVLMPSPVGHISGVIHGVLGPALLGTCAVMMDRWSADEAISLIERERITMLVGAPTFLQEILAHPDSARHDLSSLRLCSSGGASVPPELMRLGRERVPSMVTKRSYGSSEFPTIATTTAEDAATRGLDTEGRALPGVEIRITDEAGGLLPPGAEGEIRARGPECFLGYVDASLDAEAFDERGFYRTGDLGILDDDGYLRVTGRIKEIIVRKGEKISAREIEDLLAEHPAVAEVAVIPVADPVTGERACACLRLRPGADAPDLDGLARLLLERGLSTRKLPEQIHLVDDFPRSPSGKIHKRLLREAVERAVAVPPVRR